MNSKNKMQMQLRQFRKKKYIGDEDLGYEEKPPKSHKKTKPKVSIEKERSMDEVSYIQKIIILFQKIVFKFFKRK
jgi:hypothetical protein